MDIGYAGLFELDPVRRGKIEEKSIAGGCYEFGVEVRGDICARVVAAAADSGPDACPDVLRGRAELVMHRLHRRLRDAGDRAAPTGMRKAHGPRYRVPEHDRVAVCVGGEQAHTFAVGDQAVDALEDILRLIPTRPRPPMHCSELVQ